MLLEFPQSADHSADSLLPLKSNSQAGKKLMALNHGDMLLLEGLQGTGKTHLLKFWCQMVGGVYVKADQVAQVAPQAAHVAVDDLQLLKASADEALFHLYNRLKAEGGTLVVATDAPVKQLGLLPDLSSRLLAMDYAELNLPTEADLHLLLLKWAQDRQLQLNPQVISYLLKKAERSPVVLEGMIGQLDQLSLQRKKAISVPIVREVLQASSA